MVTMETFTFIPKDFEIRNWKGYTLVYAGSSIGNVGALCLEIVLENTIDPVEKVAHIEDDALLPMVGRIKNKNGDTRLCYGLELYEVANKKLLFVLQRSPFIKGRLTFRQKLISWFQKNEFKEFITLSSVSSHICTDKDINSLMNSPFRYVSTFENIGEDYPTTNQWTYYDVKKTDSTGELSMPGSGLAGSIYKQCKKENLLLVGLLTFTSAGYNLAQAKLLCSRLNELIHVVNNTDKLTLPSVIINQLERPRSGYLY